MNILAVDTTGGVCSVALSCEGQLTCELYLHDKLTHSQKLMPLVDDCLAFAGREIADVDAFAVVAGPGSFTGVRIGVCAVKALAQVCKK